MRELRRALRFARHAKRRVDARTALLAAYMGGFACVAKMLGKTLAVAAKGQGR